MRRAEVRREPGDLRIEQNRRPAELVVPLGHICRLALPHGVECVHQHYEVAAQQGSCKFVGGYELDICLHIMRPGCPPRPTPGSSTPHQSPPPTAAGSRKLLMSLVTSADTCMAVTYLVLTVWDWVVPEAVQQWVSCCDKVDILPYTKAKICLCQGSNTILHQHIDWNHHCKHVQATN